VELDSFPVKVGRGMMGDAWANPPSHVPLLHGGGGNPPKVKGGNLRGLSCIDHMTFIPSEISPGGPVPVRLAEVGGNGIASFHSHAEAGGKRE